MGSREPNPWPASCLVCLRLAVEVHMVAVVETGIGDLRGGIAQVKSRNWACLWEDLTFRMCSQMRFQL